MIVHKKIFINDDLPIHIPDIIDSMSFMNRDDFIMVKFSIMDKPYLGLSGAHKVVQVYIIVAM